MYRQDDDRLWQSHDTGSDKSLVEGGILVTQTWAQSWHNTAQPRAEGVKGGLETDYEMEMISGHKNGRQN